MNPANILIADDESNIRLMLRTTLDSEGYTLREACDGRDALRLIAEESPDVLLLDLSMPVMDGMTVLARLQELPAGTRPRVIVFTAYGSITTAVKAVRLGASDFLEKPVTPEELRSSVARVLGEPRDLGEPDLGYSELLTQVRKDLFTGDFTHAEALLMRAAELAGADPAYFNLLGVLHEAEGREDVAKKFYARAMKAKPSYLPAEQNMRRLYELKTFGRTKIAVAIGSEQTLLDQAASFNAADRAKRLRKLLHDDITK